tara:strand:+ start:2869 stop:3525 length:657 start_codon:yes stop_codon:yes gene_type:complete
MNKYEIYEIVIDEVDNETGLLRNSFVQDPAVEYTKIDFSKDGTELLNFSANDTEQKFMSVSLVADRVIPRLDKFNNEYGVYFSVDGIAKIVNKFIISGAPNEVSYQHTDELIEGVYLVEHFITKEGIVEAPSFKDLPYGSWVTTYHVPDVELYNKLKADETFKGFSVEIAGLLEAQFANVVVKLSDDELETQIKTILDSDSDDNIKEIEIKSLLGLDI